MLGDYGWLDTTPYGKRPFEKATIGKTTGGGFAFVVLFYGTFDFEVPLRFTTG
jgi:hypothetical protein